jgi:hypothetical protein
MGHPCARRIAHKLAGTPPVNTETSWRPTVGTAVHTWLERTFAASNQKLGETRWLIETTVEVGQVGEDHVTGSCDIYDRITALSNDWKIVGPNSLKKYRTQGPGQQYRTQGHLYGYGWTRRGLPVDTVAITFLPSNGELADAVFWHEPYDEQVALDAITRVDAIAGLVKAAGPLAPAALPTTDAWCTRCPYYLPAATELTEACPGHPVVALTTRPTAA